MIDFARITVKSGDGGKGAGSFLHIKGKRLGKADGGNGGCGGNVYLETSADLNTLESFRYVKDYKAPSGINGLSRRRRGADGEDLIIKVPPGTVVRLESTGPARLYPTPTSSLSKDQIDLQISKFYAAGARAGTPRLSPASSVISAEVYDLVNEGDKVLVARGGEGGRGNCHLRDEFGRRPKAGEAGGDGEVKNLTLELKLIADIGIIGLPNCGKSTLLSALTSARPAIANYPFTTLEPNLGVINAGPARQQKRIVLADIPGLIEGASKGKGLGDLFLRHIERTKILVHLIDISAQSDKWHDWQIIRGELKGYSKELSGKREIIVLNKIDLVDKETVKKVAGEFGAKRKKILAISAAKKEGLEELLGQILKILRKIKA